MTKIRFTFHFLSGHTLEREWFNHDNFKQSDEEFAEWAADSFLKSKLLFAAGDNTFLPSSQIAKVTWKEVER